MRLSLEKMRPMTSAFESSTTKKRMLLSVVSRRISSSGTAMVSPSRQRTRVVGVHDGGAGEGDAQVELIVGASRSGRSPRRYCFLRTIFPVHRRN